jgi:hypothetical protein
MERTTHMVVLTSGISVLGQAPATAFYISVPLVLVEQLHANGNGGSPATLSDAVVEHIVAEVGVERIWRALDKLTQPQLPLQAAQ